MNPVLVLSPHYDDAVLSAGQFLAGRADCVVATVFTAIPETTALTAYDAKCGFVDATHAVTMRRAENVDALALLKATGLDLGFTDGQYGDRTSQGDLADSIADAINDINPEFVLGPLGLLHPDHVLVREALLDVLPGQLWLYEELPYRVTNPETVTDAMAAIEKRGYTAQHGQIGTGPAAMKLAALWHYRSQMQLPDFDNVHNLLVAERFWRICG